MNHWQFILSKILQKKTVYLLTVSHHKGSSPGRQGFKMVVANDAEIYGSIGGGVMEFNLAELCKELLQKGNPKSFIKHQIHKGTIVDGSGMICSGEQTVIFYPLDYLNLDFVVKIVDNLDENKSGLLSINPNSVEFSTNKASNDRYSFIYKDENNWSYHEQLNQKDILYIIGGGHVSLATSKLFKELGFYTFVFDDRANLNTLEANSYANKKEIVDYENIAAYIPESNYAYVAIMTNKYTDDKIVLSKLLDKSYKFIGVLGSSAKLKLMLEVLEKEGFNKNILSKIHAPIGIKIFSQTPEEIAVSIAAQITSIKNQKK
jgi:xanthine dehydrogenase accessory factor